jgi:hypothetical protein
MMHMLANKVPANRLDEREGKCGPRFIDTYLGRR